MKGLQSSYDFQTNLVSEAYLFLVRTVFGVSLATELCTVRGVRTGYLSTPSLQGTGRLCAREMTTFYPFKCQGCS